MKKVKSFGFRDAEGWGDFMIYATSKTAAWRMLNSIYGIRRYTFFKGVFDWQDTFQHEKPGVWWKHDKGFFWREQKIRKEA